MIGLSINQTAKCISRWSDLWNRLFFSSYLDFWYRTLRTTQVDSRGTLLKGSLLSGAVCMVTAALVPFDALDDIISAGVLLAFNFVTSSLLVLRYRWVLLPHEDFGRVC